MKENIRNLPSALLKETVVNSKEKAFRARQVEEWIWKKGIVDFDQMLNIPAILRETLKNQFVFNEIALKDFQKSTDGTIKCSFRLFDNQFIEGVIIPSKDRITICISSQVGCKLKCTFCATGKIGFTRNLETGEIYDQVRILNELSLKHFNKRITNIVLMGMGEPLYNYANVNEAIEHITSENGLGFSPKRITLSTIGIPVMIKKLADDQVKYNLAVSLHAAIQEKRLAIMPVAKNHTLSMLLESLQYFTKITGRKVTFEYVLLRGINDSIEDAEALVKYSSHIASKINLIEYNPIDGTMYDKSEKDNVIKFLEHLNKKGLNAHIRKSRGEDIDAACGQLANKLIKTSAKAAGPLA